MCMGKWNEDWTEQITPDTCMPMKTGDCWNVVKDKWTLKAVQCKLIVLKIAQKCKDDFQKWMDVLFLKTVPFSVHVLKCCGFIIFK